MSCFETKDIKNVRKENEKIMKAYEDLTNDFRERKAKLEDALDRIQNVSFLNANTHYWREKECPKEINNCLMTWESMARLVFSKIIHKNSILRIYIELVETNDKLNGEITTIAQQKENHLEELNLVCLFF
jgi:hypothetical protein